MGRTAKGYKGVGMNGPIAHWYATNTAKDQQRHQDQARMAMNRAPLGSAVLEIAPGPGYTSIELARTGDYAVTGLDISPTFVEMARRNAEDAGVRADFRLGNVATMPFRNETFDFVLCCAAFKNFAEPVRAIREIHRVLRPEGRALIIDRRRDAARQAVAEDVHKMGLSPINSAMTRFTLTSVLPRRAYTRTEFARFTAHTDFSSFEIVERPLSLEIDLFKAPPAAPGQPRRRPVLGTNS